MFLNKLMLLGLIILSIILFMINNLYILVSLFVLLIILMFFNKVKIHLYLPLIILLVINFVMNYFFGNLKEALVVTLRLVIMFMSFNLVIKKLGIYQIGEIIGSITRSREISLIILISLSFIPIMMKEIKEIRRSLVTKNYPLNFMNILRKPSVFVITFFTNLFKRVDEMEKVLKSRRIE